MSDADYITKTSIPGLFVVKRPVFPDERGFFHEIFRLNDLEAVSGIEFKPVQWSHARSNPKVIRGIHTEGWNKLIYPVSGKMFVAIADVRPESSTFGKVETFDFDADSKDSNHKALFLSAGLGNSICVTSKTPLDYIYLVDEYWDNKKAQGIAWDDPDLNVDWPIKDPIISKRDRNNPKLKDLYPDKFK
jgi:dTDP-4-dehydrorhamnose 3,5-epimerase